MTTEKELTPEQQFNKILGEAAVNIKRLEQQRDTPQRPGGPAPRLVPPGAPPPSGGHGNNQAHKDRLDDQIGNLKADTIRKTDQLISKMPAHVQKDLQARTLNTLYPTDKKDLNQIPQKDKAVDNAQERFNNMRAGNKSTGKQQDQPSRFSQNLNPQQQERKDQRDTQVKAAKNNQDASKNPKQQDQQSGREEKMKSAKENGQDITKPTDKTPDQDKPAQSDKADANKDGKIGSMGTRFTQSLNGKPTQKDNPTDPNKDPESPGPKGGAAKPGGAKINSDGKIGSMGTRFTQSLGPGSPGSGTVPSGKSSPASPGKSGGPSKD